MVCGRLRDGSANVRKRTLQVIQQLVLIFSCIFQNETFMKPEEVGNEMDVNQILSIH
jgi:hypothetical protein